METTGAGPEGTFFDIILLMRKRTGRARTM